MLLVRLSVKRRLLVTNILGNRKLDVDFQLHKGSAFLTPELFNSQLYVINVVFKIEIFFPGGINHFQRTQEKLIIVVTCL